MRRLKTLVLGTASLAVTLALVASGGAFLLLQTDRGQSILEAQTEGVAGRLLGPNYRAHIGKQSISFSRDGRLAIRWDGVSVSRAGVDEPEVRAKTIAVGLDGPALLRAEVKLRSLEVSGVDVDVTPVPEASEVAAAAEGLAPGSSAPVTPPVTAEAAKALLPALAARLFGRSESQLDALVRLGIERAEVSDVRLTLPVAPGGGPFVAYVETLNADLADPQAMMLTGTLRLDDSRVPIETRIAFDPQAKRLTQAHSRVGPFDLAKLLPPGDRNNRTDMRPFGSDADMSVTMDIGSKEAGAPRDVAVSIRLDEGHIHQGRGHVDIDRAGLALHYLEGEDRLSVDRIDIAAEDFAAELSGVVLPVYDRPGDGGFNGFAFTLKSDRLSSAVGSSAGTETGADLELSGRTEISSRLGRIDRLELRSGDGSMSGNASIGYGGPDARMRVNLAFANMAASTVKAFWPFDVAVAPRAWVLQNIGDAGRVADGRIALDVLRQRMAEAARLNIPYTAEELQIDLALQGVQAKSFGDLPALVGAEGTVEVRGGDTLVTVAKAGVEGMPDTALEGGLVTFSRPAGDPRPVTEMRIAGNFAGAAGDVLRIAEREPLSSMVQLPVTADSVTGKVRTVADLTMLLGEPLPNGRAMKGWKLGLTLADVGVTKPVSGRRLADFAGPVTLTPDAVEGELTGSVDGASGKVSFRRAIGADTEQPKLSALLRIDGSEAAKIVPALADIVSGPIEARIVQSSDTKIAADVDLASATLNLPWIGWRKGKGVGAKLAFAASGADGRTTLGDIALTGDGFSAHGNAELDAQGLRKAELSDVALNPGDDVGVEMDRMQNGYSIAIRGKRFDARPLLTDIRSDIGGKTATPKQGGRQIDVSAAVAEVVGFGKETVSDFSLNYAGSGARIAALSISGKNKGAAPFSVELSPRGDNRSIQVDAANAGALLDFTGAYGHMDGGRLRLTLVGDADHGYSGKIEVKNFALVDEPRLSRLVAAPPAPNSQSLSQLVGRDLQTARASFDHASAGIGFGKGGLVLRDGIIRGPIFGSSFAGTLYDPRNRIDISGSFMPAYGLNRVFGAIPVVGQILGNGREGGLIGITYRLSGEFASPKLEINPISAIAPGIFRNIFAYQ